jgi:hypothetical protein
MKAHTWHFLRTLLALGCVLLSSHAMGGWTPSKAQLEAHPCLGEVPFPVVVSPVTSFPDKFRSWLPVWTGYWTNSKRKLPLCTVLVLEHIREDGFVQALYLVATKPPFEFRLRGDIRDTDRGQVLSVSGSPIFRFNITYRLIDGDQRPWLDASFQPEGGLTSVGHMEGIQINESGK